MSADNSAENEGLTRYLFGEMSETEQMQLELRYFDDPQMFAELCAWRNNLIDHYVVGELSPSMRQRFEAGIEKSWAINERIRFAETLQEAMETRGESAASHRRTRTLRLVVVNYRRPLFAAVFLLLLLAAVWVVIRVRNHQAANDEEDGLQTSATAPSAPDRAASASLESAETPSATSTSNAMLVVTLTSDVTRRASDATREIQIPPNTVIVHLLLIVDRPQLLNYRGVLTTLEGAKVFETGRAKANANETGRVVELYVPANLMPDGDYVVRLSSVTADDKLLGVGNYYFRVRKL